MLGEQSGPVYRGEDEVLYPPIEKQCNRECKRRVPKGIDGSY